MQKNTKISYLIASGLFLLSLSLNFKIPIVLASGDNTAPQITAFSITPTEFNTQSEDQTLTLNVTLTDDIAGVCTSSDCGNYNSSASQVRITPFDDGEFGVQSVYFYNYVRTSGDDKNGTYTATATVPRNSRGGTWKVQSVFLADKLGNYVSLDAEDLLAAVPDATGVTLTNDAVNSDSNPPVITAFHISPTSFNTENGSQLLTLSITLTDDDSGVCTASDCGVSNNGGTQIFITPNDDSYGSQSTIFYNLTRISGDDKNGTYTATTTIPQNSKGGAWKVQNILLEDKLGNYRWMNAEELLAAVPDATGVTLTNTATDSDSTAPTVTSFSIHPIEFNTDSEEQTLTLDITLADNIAGVCVVGDCGNYNSSPTQVTIAPLIGTQSRVFFDFTRTSGDDKNGTYTATTTIPKNSKEGIWKVGSVLLVDKLGNYRWLDTEGLLAAVPDASGVTLANTAETSEVTIDRDWTISSDFASVSFTAGTVVTKKEGGSFAFYRMTNQNTDLEDLINVDEMPAMGLVDQYGNPLVDENGDPIYDEINALTAATIRIGIPNLNLNFSQSVTISLSVDSKYNGHRLNISSLTEDGDSWSQETSCLVSKGKCRFTADHATYFTAMAGKGVKVSKVSTPTASLKGGTYNTSKNMTLKTSTKGATIYYTTDGSTPTTSSNVYSAPISITSTQTIKAMASKAGMLKSSVMTKTYTLRVATPKSSPKPREYRHVQTVSLSTSTPDATIYYTTDGSTPTTSSTPFALPIVVSSTQTIKAIAVKDGWSNSKLMKSRFTINLLQVKTPAISPKAGTYLSAQTVTISTSTSGATIYYTTDGSTPTTASTQYPDPFMIYSSQTIKAIAVKDGMKNSKVTTKNYTLVIEPT
jgi:hypothetical protein